MDKNLIKQKLEQSKKKTYIVKEQIDINPINKIQIAKKGSKVFYEYLYLFCSENKYYVVLCDKHLPSSVEIVNLHNKKGLWDIKEISQWCSEVIDSAIIKYNRYSHYHLNPYTFLVTQCLAEGLDLIEENILEL